MVRILCTKQLSITDIQAFTQAGFSIETIDFIQILPFSSFDHISPFEYGIFTSTNALSALIQNPAYQDIPCRKAFCVGEKTQKFLQENGWEVIASFPYASLLASYLVENFPQASMAFFCGDKRLDTLPHTLKEHQIPFQEIQTYQTLLTPKHLETSAPFFQPLSSGKLPYGEYFWFRKNYLYRNHYPKSTSKRNRELSGRYPYTERNEGLLYKNF